MNIALMNPRLTALATALTAVAVAAAALFVALGSIAQVEASQAVDAKVAGHALRVKGTKDDDKLTLRLHAGDANIIEIDAGDDGTADFSFDRASFTAITVNAKNGNDLIRVDEVNGPIVEPTSILGGNGNDTILGGSAVETIDSGDGDDFVDGNRAADIAFMGDGNDTFRWDPGDGSDVVEGEDGSDTLLFNGAAGGETVDLSANGERFAFFRQPGNITMDMNEVEVSVFNALGGQDTMTVNDLTGTDVTQVNLELEIGPGNGGADLLADQVIVNGTDFNDVIFATGSSGNVNVAGLAAGVAISHAEAANDVLSVNALGLNDIVDASGLQADAIKQLRVEGGVSNDFILGSHGADELTGGDGHDFIDGNQGVDTAFMGAGDDAFRWDPGDGSDVVEGEDGSDTLLFNGAAGGDTVDLSGNGERFTFFRQPGNITMDVNEVEVSVFNALGGQDTITVNDLAPTDVKQVVLNLAAGQENNASDGLQDQVTVKGTAGNDAIVVAGSAGNVNVTGLTAGIAITLADPIDRLDINTLDGNDTVDASGLAAGVKQLTVDGGSGDDQILGGRGADVLTGGDGSDFVDGNQAADVAFMGAGDDTFRWDPGDGSDVVEGEDGSDTLLFNGANGGETVDLSANGERFIFFRQPGNITMDTNEVEISVFNALGGPDTITVNDLTGTDMTLIGLDLGAGVVGGASDGEAAHVFVNGTANDDSIHVNGTGAVVGVFGLSATVGVRHADAGIDRLDINTLAGNDTVDTSGLPPGVIQLFVDGVPV